MKNIEDLRDQLIDVFENVKDKKLSKDEGNTLANISGKIIKSASLEFEYNKYVKNSKKIIFLEV